MTSTMAPARALRQRLLAELEEARARTLLLVAPLSDEELHTQHDPLMSPILWDLGHIAHFEELWLTRNLDGPIEFVEMPGMYNPFEHPRSTRGALPLPGLDRVREVMSEIRARVLDRLQSADFDADQPLLAGGYVYRMVLQHEYQHNETILQTLQLKQGTPYSPPARVELPVVGEGLPVTGMVRFPGGRVEIGTDDRTEAYDNERPRHAVDVRPFEIDAHPVTNGQYLEFIEAGGYARPELWSEAGRRWLEESRAEAPKYWFRSADGWMTRVMDRVGAGAAGSPGLPRVLLRGRGLRALGGEAAAERDRVGGGGIVGSGHRSQAPVSRGVTSRHLASSRTWISSASAPRRSPRFRGTARRSAVAG